MRIIVFGSNKCKYCKTQVEHLANTFDEEEWLYIDVMTNKDALKIARDINIKDIPSVILVNERSEQILKKSGTMPPDQIIGKLINRNDIVPFSNKMAPLVKSGTVTATLLSFDPGFKIGGIIEGITYSYKSLGQLVVTTCQKVSLKEAKEIIGEEIVENYLECGGRKDLAYLIGFSKGCFDNEGRI